MVDTANPMTDTHSSIRPTRIGVLLLLFVAGVAVAGGSGTATAAAEANLTVSDTPTEPVQPGDSFTIDISLTNIGTEDGTVIDIRTTNLPDNISSPNAQVGLDSLAPGETETRELSVSVDEDISDGTYNLTAYGDVGGGAAAATTPIEFTVDSITPLAATVKPDTVDVGTTTPVTVTVTEAGSTQPVPNATVTRIDTVTTTPVNSSGRAVIRLSPTETGNVTLDITAPGYGLATKNVTVVSGEPAVDRFDSDSDGIGREDTIKVIVAYNNGSEIGGRPVSRDAAIAVIKAYKTG
jgi:uncharacterized membrane protein